MFKEEQITEYRRELPLPAIPTEVLEFWHAHALYDEKTKKHFLTSLQERLDGRAATAKLSILEDALESITTEWPRTVQGANSVEANLGYKVTKGYHTPKLQPSMTIGSYFLGVARHSYEEWIKREIRFLQQTEFTNLEEELNKRQSRRKFIKFVHNKYSPYKEWKSSMKLSDVEIGKLLARLLGGSAEEYRKFCGYEIQSFYSWEYNGDSNSPYSSAAIKTAYEDLAEDNFQDEELTRAYEAILNRKQKA